MIGLAGAGASEKIQLSFLSSANESHKYTSQDKIVSKHTGRGKYSTVNFMVYDRLQEGLISKKNTAIIQTTTPMPRKNEQEIIMFCLREFCLINELLQAKGNVNQAKTNMESFILSHQNLFNEEFCNDRVRHINNLITIFSNKEDSWWEVKINRGAAKYVAALNQVLMALSSLNTEALTNTLNEHGLSYKDIKQEIDKFLNNANPDYIRNVKASLTGDIVFIHLGAPGGTMGDYNEFNFSILRRKLTELEEKFSNTYLNISKIHYSKERNISIDLSMKLNMHDVSNFADDIKTARQSAIVYLNKHLQEKNLKTTIGNLNLSKNNLTQQELNIIFRNNKKAIINLDLSDNQDLTSLPDSVLNLKSLKAINLTGTNFSKESTTVKQLVERTVTVMVDGCIIQPSTKSLKLITTLFEKTTDQIIKTSQANANLNLAGEFKNSGYDKIEHYENLNKDLQQNSYSTVDLSDNGLRFQELENILLRGSFKIETLNLSNNKNLDGLPDKLPSIEGLKHLNITGTEIGSLIQSNVEKGKAPFNDLDQRQILENINQKGIKITYAENRYIEGAA